MAAAAATMMVLFEQLSPATRRKLHITELEEIKGAAVIADRIHQAYSNVAAIITALQRAKRADGYCGGEPSCVVYLGEKCKAGRDTLCSKCRLNARMRREGVTKFKKTYSEYGKLRAKQREQEKGERPLGDGDRASRRRLTAR